MGDEICVESAFLYLLGRKISCELVDYRAYHFEVSELLRADIGEQSLELSVGHGEALTEIAQRRAELPVRSAVLVEYYLCVFRVRICYLYRILKLLFIYKHQQPHSSVSHGHGSLSHSAPVASSAVSAPN